MREQLAVMTGGDRSIRSPDPRLVDLLLAAFHRVHARLGPGFGRGVYRRALAVEIEKSGGECLVDVELEVFYRDRPVGTTEPDLVVGGSGLVLIGAGRLLSAENAAQLANVVRATGWPWGLWCNFGPVPEHWLVADSGATAGNLGGVETRAVCAP